MQNDARYRSISSIGRELLPEAERMHRAGMPWRKVARNLKVSYTSLFTWRKLKGRQGTRISSTRAST